MNIEEFFAGDRAPVEVKATNCHTVHVNIHLTIEPRAHDTLRCYAQAIEAYMAGNCPAPEDP